MAAATRPREEEMGAVRCTPWIVPGAGGAAPAWCRVSPPAPRDICRAPSPPRSGPSRVLRDGQAGTAQQLARAAQAGHVDHLAVDGDRAVAAGQRGVVGLQDA